MDIGLRGGGSGFLLQLLDGTPQISDLLAQCSQITWEWIENWKIPKARGESLVNIMNEKMLEIEVFMEAQALAPQSKDLNTEIVQRKAKWGKCYVELLQGIVFKTIMVIEELQKEARALTNEVGEKETEIGGLRKKAEDDVNSRVAVLMESMTRKTDDKLRIESLENQLAEKCKATQILEIRVRDSTHRLREKFLMDITRKRGDADTLQSESEEACRLEWDVIFESFRAAFLDTEWKYSQLEKEPSETRLRSLESTSLTKGGQKEDLNLSVKMASETQPVQGGGALLTEMDMEHRQVETKRLRDGEENEEPNVPVKRRVLTSSVPGAGERSKDDGNMELEEELEILTFDQYRDAMLGS